MEESPRKLKVVGSVPEAVYNILKDAGSPMHHKEITDRILAMLPDSADADPKLIARIHTDINLDNRFYHMGNGMWGLREWAPKKVLQQKATPAGWQPKGAGRAKRPELWPRGDDDADEPKAADEEESDWPRDNDEDDRPEA